MYIYNNKTLWLHNEDNNKDIDNTLNKALILGGEELERVDKAGV